MPVALTAAKYYGVDLAEEQLVELINALVAVVSAVLILAGLVRKAFNLFR